MINDVSGLRHPAVAEACGRHGAGLVVMHTRAEPKVKAFPDYDDVVDSDIVFLAERIAVARASGVEEDKIVIDPGPDFAKTPAETVDVLRRLADLRELGPEPVRAVVNTHGHNDHAFGNHRFRPAPIWGHANCARFIRETGAAQIAAVSAAIPDIAEDLAEVVLDPPDRTFDGESATLDFDAGGRRIDLRYIGRGHTDNDILVIVPDADVMFAGDLVENGATPYFGDGYPMEWPATLERLIELVTGAVVPGHGDVGDRAFAIRSMVEIRTVAELASLVHDGTISLEDAVLRTPYPADTALTPLERGLAQLRGELG